MDCIIFCLKICLKISCLSLLQTTHSFSIILRALTYFSISKQMGLHQCEAYQAIILQYSKIFVFSILSIQYSKRFAFFFFVVVFVFIIAQIPIHIIPPFSLSKSCILILYLFDHNYKRLSFIHGGHNGAICSRVITVCPDLRMIPSVIALCHIDSSMPHIGIGIGIGPNLILQS